MARQYKIYTGNLDGMRTGLVMCCNKEILSRVIGASVYHTSQYWAAHTGKTGYPNDVTAWVSTFEPDTLYTKSNLDFQDKTPWVKGKCVLEQRGQRLRPKK